MEIASRQRSSPAAAGGGGYGWFKLFFGGWPKLAGPKWFMGQPNVLSWVWPSCGSPWVGPEPKFINPFNLDRRF